MSVREFCGPVEGEPGYSAYFDFGWSVHECFRPGGGHWYASVRLEADYPGVFIDALFPLDEMEAAIEWARGVWEWSLTAPEGEPSMAGVELRAMHTEAMPGYCVAGWMCSYPAGVAAPPGRPDARFSHWSRQRERADAEREVARIAGMFVRAEEAAQ